MPPAVPFFPAAGGGVPCPRARGTFCRSPQNDPKRCLKPQGSRLPARLGGAEKRGRVPRENQDSADRRTTNRVRSSSHCRSCVPRGGALVYRCGRLSNRALAAAGKCRCGRRGAGGKITRGVKHFHCTERTGKFPLWNVGAAAGMGGDSGLCLRRVHFFSSGKGMFRALGHGSLLAAAPKVTKNAA